MSLFSIDGVSLPTPTDYSISLQDLDSEETGRNEKGILLRTRLRQGVYKIELKWSAINSSKVQTLMSATSNASVNVTFPTYRGKVTRRMYVGDRVVDSVLYRNGNNPMWEVSFNLIEY